MRKNNLYKLSIIAIFTMTISCTSEESIQNGHIPKHMEPPKYIIEKTEPIYFRLNKSFTPGQKSYSYDYIADFQYTAEDQEIKNLHLKSPYIVFSPTGQFRLEITFKDNTKQILESTYELDEYGEYIIAIDEYIISFFYVNENSRNSVLIGEWESGDKKYIFYEDGTAKYYPDKSKKEFSNLGLWWTCSSRFRGFDFIVFSTRYRKSNEYSMGNWAGIPTLSFNYKVFEKVLNKPSVPNPIPQIANRVFYSKEYKYEFTKDEFTTTEYMNNEIISYKYSIEKRGENYYIKFGDNYENEYLILFNRYSIFLYENDNELPVFYGIWHVPRHIDSLLPEISFSTSSYYETISESYPSSNIGNYRLFNPWVEGITGNGIGETITIHNSYPWFSISNGFVSFDKPHLYLQNSRIKKIRVNEIGSDEYFDFELKDTPNHQEIYLDGFQSIKSDWMITIIDVYTGTHFDDTCINFIIENVWMY